MRKKGNRALLAIRKMCGNTVGMLAIPVVTYLFFFVVCNLAGTDKFGVGTDFRTILVTTVQSGLIALAVSYNLTSGRFDFSIGSVLILSNVIGYKIALDLGLGPVPLAIVTVVAGMILGLGSGLVYVLLKLPPMVCSLGVAMIYEAIAFIITGGSGVKLLGRNNILLFDKFPAVLIMIVIVIVVLFVLYNITPFGYHCRSLQTGQEISVNVGIDERKNSLACYIIAGGLMAAAGLIEVSRLGTVTIYTGLGSSKFLMSAFLPMFIGTFLARFGDRNIGVIMGAFAQACCTSAFGALEFGSHLKDVLSNAIVLVFLFVTNNLYKLEEVKLIKARRKQAKAELE